MATYKTNLSDRSDLSAVHINSHLEDYESARSNFFQFIIEDFDDLVRPDFEFEDELASEADIITNGADVIRLSVETSSVPSFSVTALDVERGNSVVHFASKPTWSEGSLVVKDFVGLHTKDVIKAWQRLVYNPITDKAGRAGTWVDRNGVTHKGYKRNCKLLEYTPDFVKIREIDLIGCFPTDVTEPNFDKKKDDPREIEIKFVYDRAIMHSSEI